MMFKNLFNRQNSKTKSIFLAGWEVHLNGDPQCENFIATQITNKGTIETLYSGIELIFENDKLVKAFGYEEGNKKSRDPLAQSLPPSIIYYKTELRL